MASAFNKEVRRSITHSLGRFLAIAIIAALGCGFYAGLRMTPIDMNLSADAFYNGTNMSDIYLSSTLGFDDEDVEEISQIQGVGSAAPFRMIDAYAMLGDAKYVVNFESLDVDAARASDCSDGASAVSEDDAYINRPVLVEGTWPENPGECVIAAEAVLDEPVQIGDVVKVVDEGDETAETFARTEFTVTGKVFSPYFVMTSNFGSSELGSGEIDTYVYVYDSAFAKDYPYTGIFLTVDGAKEQTYPGTGYEDVVNPVVERIEGMSFELRSMRLAAVQAKAQKELDEKRAEFEDERAEAYAKLDDAAAELEDAKAKLDDASNQISTNEAKLADAKKQLADGRKELADNKKLLDDQQAQLDEGMKQLGAGQEQLDVKKAAAESEFAKQQAEIEQNPNLPPEMKAQYLAALAQKKADAEGELAAAQAEIDAKKAELDKGAAKLAKGWEAYETGKKASEDGQRSYDEGISKLEKATREYEDGLAKYNDGMAEYHVQRADALRELADAETKLNDAQADIDAIELPDLYVLDRSKNIGAEGRRSDAERIDQIAQVFPFIFFLVAALVSLTTMTRMVDEERMLIGTYKALGYSSARISSKYLIYAFVASGVGCVIGILALTQFLPQFIMQAYSIIYAVPVSLSPIDIPLALMAAGLTIGITVLATLFAVLSTLRERPALLMLPRAPKPGKRILLERIGFIWKHLSFTWKVTARNIFRYKRRFLMAIIGIAGCTALLLTGLGLHDGINDIIDKQFGEIQHFNLSIQSSDEQSEGNAQVVQDILDGHDFVTERTFVASQNAIASSANIDKDVRAGITVPQSLDEFEDFYTLRERVTHEPLGIQGEGAVITEKLASELGVQKGDVIELYDMSKVGERDGEAHEVVVSGITEFYTGQRVFMNKDVYEAIMGAPAQFTDILSMAHASFDERTELANELLDVGGVEVVSYIDEIVNTYRKMLNTVNAVVIVLIVAAALLAFVVLYNLTNINITERTREIATLKVLGFTPHETNAYIYRETILLTIIGALIGCLLGVWMEGFVVVTAEVDQMMFGREIHVMSFAIAFVLTVAFSVIVTLAMKPKLKSINMVESLKSVD